MCLLHFWRSDPSVRYRNRSAKDGPESRMMQAFMVEFERRLKKTGNDYAIFYEPQMPTGYPDCVVVRFDATAYEGWGKGLPPLTDTDLRILHFLSMSRSLTLTTLARKSGFQMGALKRSLDRLCRRGLVRMAGTRWSAVPCREASGIRHIVSLEAKMSDCRGVLDQAVLNRTFANESYVLMPTQHPSETTLSAARDSGLGIYLLASDGKSSRILKPALRRGRGMSYAVWYFNEWIGRRLAKCRRRSK